MATGALFGNASSRGKSKNLVEFKAGKMYLKGNMCHPDKRKGLLYVYQADDSLMHFCWKDRSTGAVDDDLIIFPDDIEFKNVPQCKTGRVYVLKFKSSTRKYIFWMQESKADKDEENCRKVNEALNNPPTPSASRAGGGLGLPADLATLTGDNDLQSILGSMNQQQLLQLLGGMSGAGPSLTSALLRGSGGGRPVSSSQASSAEEATTPLSVRSSPGPQSRSATDGGEGMLPRPATVAAVPSQGTANTPTAATGANASSRGPGATRATGERPQAIHPAPVQLSDLQDILASVNMAAVASAATVAQDVSSVATATSAPPTAASHDVPLSAALKTALSSSRMIPVLADSSVQEKLKEHMTAGSSLPPTEELLREAFASPIFQEITNAFHSALAARQLSSLLGPFDLPDAAKQAASQGDVEAFAKAMSDNIPADTKMDEN